MEVTLGGDTHMHLSAANKTTELRSRTKLLQSEKAPGSAKAARSHQAR